MSRQDRGGSIASMCQVPEELNPGALRLSWASGSQGKGQVRVVVSDACATTLRRVVLSLLECDPCLVESRRAAVRVLDDVTAAR
jgi:hypothetical protein